ncbi:MAG: hypothetical protein ACRC46_04625 [Thermoguttaceae bacterium]
MKTTLINFTALIACVFAVLPGCEQPDAMRPDGQHATPTTNSAVTNPVTMEPEVQQTTPVTNSAVATPEISANGISPAILKVMKDATEELATVNKASQINLMPGSGGEGSFKAMQDANQKLADVLIDKLNAIKLDGCPADFKDAFEAVSKPFIERQKLIPESFSYSNIMKPTAESDTRRSSIGKLYDQITIAKMQLRSVCIKYGFDAQLGDLNDGVSLQEHGKRVEEALRKLGRPDFDTWIPKEDE